MGAGRWRAVVVFILAMAPAARAAPTLTPRDWTHVHRRVLWTSAMGPESWRPKILDCQPGELRAKGGWNFHCGLRLVRRTSGSFSAGSLVDLQEDPTAFHVWAGVPVPDRVNVPGFSWGSALWPLSFGLGAWTSTGPAFPTRVWALGALTLVL